MAKSVFKPLLAAESIRHQLEVWLNPDEDEEDSDGKLPVVAGYLLGRHARPDPILAHLAPTPEKGEPEGEDGVEQQASNDSGGPIVNLKDLDLVWSREHLEQVRRMISGGMDVLGLFVAADVDPLAKTESAAVVKKLVRLVAKQEKSSNEVAFIFLNRSSKKAEICWLDGEGTKLGAGELRTEDEETARLRWQRINGTFLFDLPLVFATEAEELSLLSDKVELALKAVGKSLNSSEMIFDGALKVDDELLDGKLHKKVLKKTGGDGKTSKKKSKGKKGKKEVDSEGDDDDEVEEEEEVDETIIKMHTAEILLEDDGLELEDANAETIRARMRLSGKLAFAANVDSSATIGEAAEAVKQDILRSLRARVRMHCDSLVGDEASGSEVADVPVLHEPPRRVLVQLPGCPAGVVVSDYLFPGETPYDSNDSVEEILGFRPPIEAFDDEIELVAGPLQAKENLAVSQSSRY